MDLNLHAPARRTANRLRAELSTRNRLRAEQSSLTHEATYSAQPSVIYTKNQEGHGNFFPSAWQAIQSNSAWAARLDKTYTASARVPRSRDRWRGELECATSSDALLMNIFCAPSTLRSTSLCAVLNINHDDKPVFGWRANVPLEHNYADRTEIDMRIGDLLVEAKLCEGDFQSAPLSMMRRYPAFADVFDIERLHPRRNKLRSYQLLRGVMAAVEHDARFALMCDARRPDLIEDFTQVLSAVRYSAIRCRLQLITWQEIAYHLTRPLQQFLAEKYGIITTAPPDSPTC